MHSIGEMKAEQIIFFMVAPVKQIKVIVRN